MECRKLSFLLHEILPMNVSAIHFVMCRSHFQIKLLIMLPTYQYHELETTCVIQHCLLISQCMTAAIKTMTRHLLIRCISSAMIDWDNLSDLCQISEHAVLADGLDGFLLAIDVVPKWNEMMTRHLLIRCISKIIDWDNWRGSVRFMSTSVFF